MLIYNGKLVRAIKAVRNGSVVGVSKVIRNGSVIWDAGNDSVSYRYPVYNAEGDPASGISCWLDGVVTDYSLVQSSSGSSRVTWNAGWYVVSGDITIDYGAICNGDVHLILTDGCSLKVKSPANYAGIQVVSPNSLNIYDQGGLNSVAEVSAIGGENAAGIGGGRYGSGSNITINGGEVTANGGNYAAGIGGGVNGAGSNITINGGTVTATDGNYAAGIGGGRSGPGSNITINGGKVTAMGGGDGAGIGGGQDGSGSNIYVSPSLSLSADSNNPPTTAIAHAAGEDIAGKLAGKRYVAIKPSVMKNWLRFTAEEDGSSVELRDVAGTYRTSTDGMTWTDYELSTVIPLAAGEGVYFSARTRNETCWNGHFEGGSKFAMAGKVRASGSIQSLLDSSCERVDVPKEAYSYLFYGCSALTQAPELPASALSA